MGAFVGRHPRSYLSASLLLLEVGVIANILLSMERRPQGQQFWLTAMVIMVTIGVVAACFARGWLDARYVFVIAVAIAIALTLLLFWIGMLAATFLGDGPALMHASVWDTPPSRGVAGALALFPLWSAAQLCQLGLVALYLIAGKRLGSR